MRSWNKLPPLAAMAIGLVTYFGSIATLVYGLVSDEMAGCSILGLSSKVTLVVLVLFAVAGGGLALQQVLPRLYDMLTGAQSPLSIANENDIVNGLRNARSVQVFVSRSDGMRTAFTRAVRDLPDALEIRVLVRDDGTPARGAALAAEVKRWNDDISAKSKVNLVIKTYEFNPMMFRGVIIDRTFAILGWYFKGKPLQQGHDLPMYRVADLDTVKHIANAFDDMFARGASL